MNLRLLFALTVALSLPAAAQPVYEPYVIADWQQPDAKVQKWVERLRKLCPEQGWTVTAKGKYLIIRRDKPVKFSRSGLLDIQSWTILPRTVEGPYRLILQFGPPLSVDKYDELAEENAEIDRKNAGLQRKYEVFLHGDYPYYLGSDADGNARKQAYIEESKKLVLHALPDLYTTENSIMLYHSWRYSQYLDSGDKAVDDECNGVEQAVFKALGCYNPNAKVSALGRGRQETFWFMNLLDPK